MDDKVSCVLCNRSEETKITGPLSTKEEVTAHQNCLLYSSGLFCRNSPQFDDLFGFTVEDVLEEVKRGNKLMCNKCRTRGATAGCEVGRCKKSYHYPCAVQERAELFEDADQGKYGLYCFNHSTQTPENNGSVNGHPSSLTKSQTSKNPSEAGSSKVYFLACEKTEGNISLESLPNSDFTLCCKKHAPASHKKKINNDSTTARRQSVCSSDSNSSSSGTRSCSKRQFDSVTVGEKQEETPSKCKSKGRRVMVLDDSSNSDENELDSEMAIYAPLETDIDESANSVSESQLIRNDTESPAVSTAGNQLQEESRDEDKDEDETIIHSDAESESLLLPVSRSPSAARATVSTQTGPTSLPSMDLVKTEASGREHSPDEHIAGPSVPQQSSAAPPPSPEHSQLCSVTGSPPRTSSAPAPPETICVTLPVSSSPMASQSDPAHNINSTNFWKSCNTVGCTQAIFTGFINEMNNIFSRIQSDQASQEDYDLALSVMRASGKLEELVAKQDEELQRKQMELDKAKAAMKEVVSGLRR